MSQEDWDALQASFHSISFPSEWGHSVEDRPHTAHRLVSIQLVSPASGDLAGPGGVRVNQAVSIQLVSPASGDELRQAADDEEVIVSIQLVSPASGDYDMQWVQCCGYRSFHSISFPSEWGPMKMTH